MYHITGAHACLYDYIYITTSIKKYYKQQQQQQQKKHAL